MDQPHILVAGAGSIGCYVGGLLAAAGRRVTFLARERIAAELREHGLRLSDLAGAQVALPPERLAVSADPPVLAAADMILVTVKSAATEEMARLIAEHARPEAVVISLQNGIGNAARLAAVLPGRTVLAGTVSFNVVAPGSGHFHRGTSGPLVVQAGRPEVVDALRVPGLEVKAAPNMEAVLWGKLLLNLNNALNALSGLPLREQLLDRRWRRLLANQQAEALAVLKVAGIRPWSMGPLPARALPHLLRLPTPLFRLLARSAVRIDREARSSMWDDLERGRVTEVEELQGAVVRLAERLGRVAPANARVLAAVKQAEGTGRGSPQLEPTDLAG